MRTRHLFSVLAWMLVACALAAAILGFRDEKNQTAFWLIWLGSMGLCLLVMWASKREGEDGGQVHDHDREENP